MAPFDRSHTSSYSPSIVTMAISCIVCEILRLTGRKSGNFYTTPAFSAPAGGDPVGISWRCLMLVKLEWLRYRMVKKLWRLVKPFSFWYRNRHGQTGRRTDRQVDIIAISISRVSVLTRDKNLGLDLITPTSSRWRTRTSRWWRSGWTIWWRCWMRSCCGWHASSCKIQNKGVWSDLCGIAITKFSRRAWCRQKWFAVK